MKATELRIGNIVDTVNHGNGKRSANKTPYIVEAIGSNIVELCHIDCDRDKYHRFLIKAISEIEPIPLTEEWLLKFGAEKFGNGDLIVNGHLIGWMDCRKVFVHRATSVELKYVHIWQNLYFALTGEELEFKP